MVKPITNKALTFILPCDTLFTYLIPLLMPDKPTRTFQGALWNTSAERGKSYAKSGSITVGDKDYKVYVYINNRKQKDTDPDFLLKIFEAEPKDGQPSPKQETKTKTDEDLMSIL